MFLLSANVAFKKPVIHHPTALETAIASKSVDGFTEPEIELGVCSQTGTGTSGNLWWRVDLERIFLVQTVEIYGASCCSEFCISNELLVLVLKS